MPRKGALFAIEPYRTDLEAWYVFLHNEGFAGFDAPYAPYAPAISCYGEAAGAREPARTFLIRDGALYVGFIDLARIESDPEALDVAAIGVLPHYRRRGLGGLLIGAAAKFGAETGARRLVADVRALDPRIHVFFTRHGFAVASLAVEIERAGGARALIEPAAVAGESPGIAIRHLVYSYRRELA